MRDSMVGVGEEPCQDGQQGSTRSVARERWCRRGALPLLQEENKECLPWQKPLLFLNSVFLQQHLLLSTQQQILQRAAHGGASPTRGRGTLASAGASREVRNEA